MTSINIHTCTLYEKVGQIQPISNMLNEPYCSHGFSTVHVYLDIVSEFSDVCLCVKLCCSKTAARLSRDFLTKNIVTLLWPAGNNDMGPIKHICDNLGHNLRSHHYVKTHPQMIPALHCAPE